MSLLIIIIIIHYSCKELKQCWDGNDVQHCSLTITSSSQERNKLMTDDRRYELWISISFMFLEQTNLSNSQDPNSAVNMIRKSNKLGNINTHVPNPLHKLWQCTNNLVINVHYYLLAITLTSPINCKAVRNTPKHVISDWRRSDLCVLKRVVVDWLEASWQDWSSQCTLYFHKAVNSKQWAYCLIDFTNMIW